MLENDNGMSEEALRKESFNMKKFISMLFVLFSLSVFCTGIAVCADESGTPEHPDYNGFGYTVKNPEDWEDLKGSLVIYPLSTSTIAEDPDVFAEGLIYFPATPEEVAAAENAIALIGQVNMPGMIFTIKGDRAMLEESIKTLGVLEQGEEESLETDLFQVGEADGYQFFALCSPDEEYAAKLDEKYAEDYRNLPALIAKEFEQARFYAPSDPMDALIGKKISFTSTDLDGKSYTSEKLFGDNEITMVNLWGVWCHNCVDEMEELAAIHERLQEKGCGVVGVEYEQKSGDRIEQEARDLMAEKGTNYPSVLMPGDNEIFNTVTSFPTTFFVDREGTILAKPIVGAQVATYEPTLEALLEGGSAPEEETGEETAEAAGEEAASQTEETAGEAKSLTYRVFVEDEDGQPLEEVTVQFCDEASCRLGETDEDGCAVFEVPEEKVYDVHILEAPDGFAYDEEEIFPTSETASDTTIRLKKE